ncbi:MAG: DUF4386 domain-containing protein [Thermoleophilia bacterium]
MARSPHAADPTRMAAFASGLFYLITFVASIPAALMLAPVLNDPGYILGPGVDLQIRLACLLDLVNALACIGSAVAVFSVLRRHHESLALGFVMTRAFEAATIVIGVVSLLAVVTLRQDGPATGTDGGSLVAVGQGLVGVRDWTFVIGPGLMPAFNALMFATVLYRARLVPRVIPAIGLVGAPLLVASAVGMILGVNDATSAFTAIATLPFLLWEGAIGLWMIFKGFDRRATAALDGGSDAPGSDPVQDDRPTRPALGTILAGRILRLPAVHRAWLVPGIAAALLANVISDEHALGLLPVIAFGILPHAPAVLGWRRLQAPAHLARRAVPVFNALHHPLVPALLIGAGLAGVGGSMALVIGLAWLGHIVVDLGLGDGVRLADWSRPAPAQVVARLLPARRPTPA